MKILSLAGALPRPPLSSCPSPGLPPGLTPGLPPGLPAGLPLAPLVPPPLPSLVPCDIFSNRDLTGGPCFSNRRGGALDPALLQPPWPWSFPAPWPFPEAQNSRKNEQMRCVHLHIFTKLFYQFCNLGAFMLYRQIVNPSTKTN